MAIVVRCPKCLTVLQAPADSAGKTVRCPKCTALLKVPASQPNPSPASVAGHTAAGVPPMGPAPGRQAAAASPRPAPVPAPVQPPPAGPAPPAPSAAARGDTKKAAERPVRLAW